MDRKLILVGAVVLLAFAAGCTGGGGDGGGSGTADWCAGGTIEAIASQQAGSSTSVESHGMTERDGRDVCRVTFEVDGESTQFASMDVFFTEGEEYVELVYYDADGNVVGEFNYSGSTDAGSGGTGDGTGDGSGTPGESASWCQAGQTTSASNPQEGSQTTFTVEGLVEHDGRTVCKATLEVSGQDAAYSRVEMFYDEDESYHHMVYYDQNGDVVYEFDVSDGA